MFVTSQGSAHGRFRRSLRTGNPNLALAAAAELPTVTLGDALDLCFLLADCGDPRFPRAAGRWLARFAQESPGVTESMQAGAALAKLEVDPHCPVARSTLRALSAG